MTAAPRPLPQILAERASLVAEVARLNSEQLRGRQLAGGLEVEQMLRRRELDGGGGEAARDALAAVEARGRAAQAELADRERRLGVLDERLESLDRELAAT